MDRELETRIDHDLEEIIPAELCDYLD